MAKESKVIEKIKKGAIALGSEYAGGLRTRYGLAKNSNYATIQNAIKNDISNDIMDKKGLNTLFDTMNKDRAIMEHPNWPKFFAEDPPAPRIITEEDIAKDPVASARYKAWMGPDKEPVFINSLPLQKNQTFKPLVDRYGPTLKHDGVSTTSEDAIQGYDHISRSLSPEIDLGTLQGTRKIESHHSEVMPDLGPNNYYGYQSSLPSYEKNNSKPTTTKKTYTDAENKEWMKAMGFDPLPKSAKAASAGVDMMQMGIGGGIGLVSGYMTTGSFGGALLGAAAGAGGSHFGWRGDGSILRKMGDMEGGTVKGIQSGMYGLGAGLASGLAVGLGRKIVSTTNQRNEGRGNY